MSKTRTAPWDYMTAQERLQEQQDILVEQGKALGKKISQEAIAKLRELDPDGWERWYDRTVPENTSYSEIIRIVSERILLLEHDPMNADGYESPMEMRVNRGYKKI